MGAIGNTLKMGKCSSILTKGLKLIENKTLMNINKNGVANL